MFTVSPLFAAGGLMATIVGPDITDGGTITVNIFVCAAITSAGTSIEYVLPSNVLENNTSLPVISGMKFPPIKLIVSPSVITSGAKSNITGIGIKSLSSSSLGYVKNRVTQMSY